MSISTWSTTPASNTQAVPDGLPDTMLVSDILGVGRQHMADIRTWYQDPQWIDLGDTPTYVSATSFTVPTDRTSFYLVGRRIKLYGSTMGTFYGTIITSSYDGVSITTIAVDIDEGNSLTNNLSQIFMGLLSPTNPSIPTSVFQDQNILVSGDLRVAPWQQGTSFTAATTPANNDGTYLVDNWILISDGNDIVDVSQETDGSMKAIVQTVNKQFGFVQFIENAKMQPIIDEGKVSVIIEAKASSISNIRCAILAWDGTSNAPTKDVVATWAGAGTNPTWAANYTAENTPANLALSSSYKDFRLNNINVDTAAITNLALVIWVDDATLGLGDTLYIRRVKLQVSPSATQFEFTSPSQSLFTAQAYYYKTFDAGVAPAQGIGSQAGALIFSAEVNALPGTNYGALFSFPAQMIKTPSVVAYNPRSGQSNNFWEGGAGFDVSSIISVISRNSALIQANSPVTAPSMYFIHATADARIGV
jgi:hypothetical protein